MLKGIIRGLRNFRRDEQGTATVESVLWLPVFFVFFVAITDASFIFFGQNQAHRVIQNANRELSVGRLETQEDVVAYLTTATAGWAPNAVVTSTIASGTVTSTLDIPASDLVAVGLFTSFVDANVHAGSSHFVEY